MCDSNSHPHYSYSRSEFIRSLIGPLTCHTSSTLEYLPPHTTLCQTCLVTATRYHPAILLGAPPQKGVFDCCRKVYEAVHRKRLTSVRSVEKNHKSQTRAPNPPNQCAKTTGRSTAFFLCIAWYGSKSFLGALESLLSKKNATKCCFYLCWKK